MVVPPEASLWLYGNGIEEFSAAPGGGSRKERKEDDAPALRPGRR
jgi:hypothetical protein